MLFLVSSCVTQGLKFMAAIAHIFLKAVVTRCKLKVEEVVEVRGQFGQMCNVFIIVQPSLPL